MLLHGALMPNNLRCTTDSEHQCEHTQSFLASEGAISNLHAGSETNRSRYQAIAMLECWSIKQTEILDAKRNIADNMYAFGYHFH